MTKIIIFTLILCISVSLGQPNQLLQSINQGGDITELTVYSLLNGQVESQTNLNLPSLFNTYGVLTQDSVNLLLIGNIGGKVTALQYDLASDQVTDTYNTNNIIGFQFSSQTFGYDSTNNIAYMAALNGDDQLSILVFDFNTQNASTISFPFTEFNGKSPSGAYDSDNGIFYLMYQDNNQNTWVIKYYFIISTYSMNQLDTFVGNDDSYLFVYNSNLFVGNVLNGVSSFYIADPAKGSTKIIAQQPNQLNYCVPFVYDPNGYVLMISPLGQSFNLLNVTTVDLISLAPATNIEIPNNLDDGSWILSTISDQ